MLIFVSGKMKRLFIGTYVNNDMFEYQLNEIKDDFKPYVFGKWVEHNNLHFTYKFLGDVEDDKVVEIKDSLKELLITYESPLEFSTLGAFPNKFKPRVLFAGMYNPGGQIFKIQKEIENKMQNFGFEKEKKKFKPHITLCRIKEVKDSPADLFDDYRDRQFGVMPEFSVNLIESELSRSGPVYKIV